MSKVHFLGLDVYEDLITAEAAKRIWEGAVDSSVLFANLNRGRRGSEIEQARICRPVTLLQCGTADE